MSFDWMEVSVYQKPESVKRQTSNTLQDQARLLRRLGYDVRYATTRCIQDFEWQFDGMPSPLKISEVKKLVAGVFN